MTTKTRAPRVAELASDEGYNLAGQPVLLAKLTAYVGRSVFAQLAQLATACQGEYSKHNAAFQFPADATAARESFAAQARVILSNPAPAAPEAPRTATQARAQSHRAARAAQSTAEAREFAAQLAAAHDKPMPAFTISYGSTVIGSIPATPAQDLDAIATQAEARADELAIIANQRERERDAQVPYSAILAATTFDTRHAAQVERDRLHDLFTDALFPAQEARREAIKARAAADRARIPATPYTDAPTTETPPAGRVSTSRPIAHTMTDRTPAGYGPSQPSLF